MSKGKKFFAQNSILAAKGHQARSFDTLDAAIAWLKTHHGGTVSQRNAGLVHDRLIGPIRTWGTVAEVVGDSVQIYSEPRVYTDDDDA